MSESKINFYPMNKYNTQNINTQKNLSLQKII